MTAARPLVRAEALGRRFRDQWAVSDVSFDLQAGEIFGLLGPNGAGKTTTVRMLASLIAPSAGRASIDGFDVHDDPDEVRARIGILTETPGLYDKLSAERNLDFFGQLHRLPSSIRAERIERFLRLFDLWDRRRDPAGEFSKGMKQKLAIARALLHDPKVVFLDEPTAALDPEAAYVVRDAIASLRDDGRAIVLCTHNLDEANRLCDRIGFMRSTLLRVDAPDRLRGEVAGSGVAVRLADDPSEDLVGRVRTLPMVVSVSATGRELSIGLSDPARDTPALVAGLVAAGAAILEVRPRAASLEDVYFEIMGFRPNGVGTEGALGSSPEMTA